MPYSLRYFLCGLLCCALAQAEPLTYSATVGGKARNASVDAFQADNQPYISLSKLLKQLGGSTRESPGKLTMDLNGKSAVVSLNGTMVSTSTASFSLHFPVKEADGGPYVAVEDLERLFDQGFGASIQRGAAAPEPEPAPAPTPATEPAPEKPASPDAEENMGLLENVNTPAPAETPATETPSTETPPAPGTPATAPVPPTPGGTYVVVIDPGHGGNDPGLSTQANNTEKDIALKVALAVEKSLAGAKNVKVVLTRKEDKDLSTAERVAVVTQEKPALLLSLHTGGSPSPAAHGLQIFVQTSAAGVAHAAGSALSGESRYQAEHAEKLLVEKTGAATRGVAEAPMRLLSSVNVPAMLIELGMLTSPAEESLLANADYQQKVAGALAALIQDAATRAGGAKPAEAK